jgi:hypothetical protein
MARRERRARPAMIALPERYRRMVNSGSGLYLRKVSVVVSTRCRTAWTLESGCGRRVPFGRSLA